MYHHGSSPGITGDVAIQVLDFKHRYHAEQRRLGSFTSSFAFADGRPVFQDLRRMSMSGLTPLEQAVLADEPTAIERELAAEAEERAREQHTRASSAAIDSSSLHNTR